MTDSVIDYALECTPAQKRARLTKIVGSLTDHDLSDVGARLYHAVSRFNHYSYDSPGSVGGTVYEALVGAIMAVKWRLSGKFT